MKKKKLLTCFGIKREENIVALIDPIDLLKGNINGFHLPEKIEKKTSAIYERGILFIKAKSKKEIQNIVNQIEILEPNIVSKKYSIFFNNKEKRILFKINKNNNESK